jgi:hypothetical protein
METNLAITLPQVRETFRDEMNFAEFPLALMDRPSEGQKTIVFSDTVKDFGRGGVPVVRKLTISASDKYGLPTPRDEEVILGLINLTHQSQYEDREVYFTKGELVRLLGWSDDGKSYDRITEALKKWLGVTLYWEKAWWSKKDACFVDEDFHILDSVTFFDKERTTAQTTSGDRMARKSSFVWNQKVFASFKAGYIKKLDFDFFKSLNSAIAKKMYRFLDKRFHMRENLSFELRTFALEKLGLSRNSTNSELKRRLRPALKELEDRGFLRKLSDQSRFKKESRGVWKIYFQRQSPNEILHADRQPSELSVQLRERGVTPRVADELTAKFSPNTIREKILYHDELLRKNDSRIGKNPAGFLVKAIRENFTIQTTQNLGKKEKLKLNNNLISPHGSENEEKHTEADLAFDTWWASKSEPEKLEIEQLALGNADVFSAKQYYNERDVQGLLFRTIRKKILKHHFNSLG